MKTGFGYDLHPLKKGRRLILGGVDIPFEKGLDGYSDADVLCHAIGDALLGAAHQFWLGGEEGFLGVFLVAAGNSFLDFLQESADAAQAHAVDAGAPLDLASPFLC